MSYYRWFDSFLIIKSLKYLNLLGIVVAIEERHEEKIKELKKRIKQLETENSDLKNQKNSNNLENNANIDDNNNHDYVNENTRMYDDDGRYGTSV